MKVKLTPEGQITIPAYIRQKLGLQGGDEILLLLEGTDLKLRIIKPKRLSEFYGTLPATVPYPGKEAIRQSVAETLAQKTQIENS
ncbi:AbrB/MazE/SpoVT family DNA-binding domain-containing protein [Coleofasciculus sp. E2-BRE-01]|jgi:AbrB family looped-hinge helix DNA binding protein|uniref:AbrB/MazE/SpoVT family DNA-binding domain-containing protein n=1 Tax=Coleofasciculus sp. E2-BRE-01 TaxID=3069524 RepID=UPI0032F7DFDA